MVVICCLGIATAFFLSFALTPTVRLLSVRKGLVDRPSFRKIHNNPVPRLGGIAMFLAVLMPLILFMPMSRETQGFLAGLTVLFSLGLVDDVRGLGASTKFPFQLLAAWLMVVIGGIKITYLNLPFGIDWTLPVWFSNLFTVFCVLALINAMNLIDGLDGLAGGVAAIIFTAVAAVGAYTGATNVVLVSVIFLGAIVGFLWYNRYPATIFMGDTGSMMLGFGLSYACLSLVYSQPHTVSTWVPLGLVSLPIFDTAWAFSRRILRGRNPFRPDKSHIHHQLIRAGVPHPKVVLILHGLTALLTLQSSLLALTDGSQIAGLTMTTLLMFFLLVRLLHVSNVNLKRKNTSS